MAIEATYFLRNNRHNCNWKQYGGEVINPGVEGEIDFFSPAQVAVACNEDEFGEYGNVFFEGQNKRRVGAKLWEGDECKDFNNSSLPILLVPGQVLQLYTKGRYVELRMNPGFIGLPPDAQMPGSQLIDDIR